jgi:hypothetical protein
MDCGGSSHYVFRNNVAHSIKGIMGISGSGMQFGINPDKANHRECNQMADFAAYKNYMTGSFSFDHSYKVIQSRMTMVDNQNGIGANIAPGGADLHRDAIM